MRIPALVLAALLTAAPALAARPDLKFKDCSQAEQAKITRAFQWLIDNLDKVDAKMGRNGLMDWPAGSRQKFAKKLTKRTQVRCINDKKVCQKAKIYGRSVPVLHQKRVDLCTRLFKDDVDYTTTIAHELSHLVRMNAHRKKCEDMYLKPRFSQSVDLAVWAAMSGREYDGKAWAKGCKP